MDSKEYENMRTIIEPAIFRSVIYIQNLKDNNPKHPYYWDNKVSTSLKCIQALMKFEDLIDFPIHELIYSIKGFSSMGAMKSITSNSIIMLEELRGENKKLNIDNLKLIKDSNDNRNIRRRNKILMLCLLLSIYFIFSLFISAFLNGGNSLIILLSEAFIKPVAFHLGFIAVAISLVTLFIKLKDSHK